jgi:hypothetical protein
LAFLQFRLTICLNEFIDAHEAATHSHHKPVVHNLRENLSCAEHVEACAKSSNGQVNAHLIDIFLEHLVDSIAPDRSISSLRFFLHIKLLSVDVGVVYADIYLANSILLCLQVITHLRKLLVLLFS